VALAGTRTYLGFGFGAIQSGLFLYEAFHSGAFGRLIVAEVQPDTVGALRRAEGYFTVNIARADGIEQARVGPVQIENPAVEADRQRLIDAIAEAEEIGTAIPSITYYASDTPGSLDRLLAQGLRKKAAENGPRAVVYAAENHNQAAEILESKVMAEIPASEHKAVAARVRFLNTVIGKMSGIVTDPGELAALRLTPVTPAERRAFLVESFNRILISRIRFDEASGEPPFRRGIAVFEEKANLLPFEEAKLYGHNATHALAAYVAGIRGVQQIANLRHLPGILPFLRAAFVQESGESLIRKHAGLDPLFTGEGYAAYADDLLERMTNPYLHDAAERVGRDPARKLGWDDRLIGTLRLAWRQGVTPRRYAFGAAAALAVLDRATLDESAAIEALLRVFWQNAAPEPAERQTVLALLETGRKQLQGWLEAGAPDLERFIMGEHL
jgi:mannitol-1-phosphate 5-dehydrogenase